jgi:hypothetical protein
MCIWYSPWWCRKLLKALRVKDYGQNGNLGIFPRFKGGQWVSDSILIVHSVYDEILKSLLHH